MSHIVYIALGSNLGNSIQKIDKAIAEISIHPDINSLQLSPLYKSKPHGPEDQPDFTNGVLLVKTTLQPTNLLAYLQKVENKMGRVRSEVWGPRVIDLDIILFDDWQIDSMTLKIPHPMAHQREFVLYPLYDLNTDLILPNHGKVAELITQVDKNNLKVVRDGATYHH